MSLEMERETLDFFQSFQDKTPLAEGEYIQDGLKHCKACGHPRQCRVPYGERQYIMRTPCKCEQEERERQEASQKAAREARKRERLYQGISEPKYRRMTFQASTKPLRFAHQYVEGFEKYQAANKGLLIAGECGTGKTFAAACIANALAEKGHSVYMAHITDITRRLLQVYDGGLEEYIHRYLKRPAVLIIDDFGAQRSTDTVREQVDMLIDIRYRTEKPMIITTNLARKDFQDPAGNLARSFERIKEVCFPVIMKGESQRKNIANNSYSELEGELGC